ncbi:MAG: excinuclease ABC subunit UvrC [Alistipes sp.]|jgi:excinuclease ABC subunit C|nr:excinuclease ABC subunit UvrC [Alistipes sp.]
MSVKNDTDLRRQAAALPLVPGVYQFVDPDGTVLYVGKAKVLRRRVANYFVESRLPSKIRVMVRKAVEIRHIVTDTETDALLLENSLIKTLQPRYNAMLKDDKTYPWIVIRREPFPRIRSTRQMVRDGSTYFGPYASIGVQRNLLEILHAVFQFRTCSLNLAAGEIARGRSRPCLKYHIGNCLAPCAGKQTVEDYDASVEMARAMLRGELGPTRRALTVSMKEAAAALRFEEAAIFKHRLDLLEGYSSRSVIVSPSLGDVDVFALVQDDDTAYCNFARIVGGNIVNSFTVRLSLGAEEDPRAILTAAIIQIAEKITPKSAPDNLLSSKVGSCKACDGAQRGVYSDVNDELGNERNAANACFSRQIIVPFLPEEALFPDLRFTVPQRGDKLRLLEFAEKNARMYRAEQLKNLEIKDPEKAVGRVMEAMMRELHLPREPHHIECFDNSNLGGAYPVAACVVFRDGKPSKREYRHFNVRTVVGADDFATMREIIFRRFTRLLEEGTELPDLVIVDGGKGQLSAAMPVFKELGITERVPLVGLAERIEEVFFPNDPAPYYLKRNGEPLKVMMHIRDEAHRFGITFHRDKRSADFIHTELEKIPGVGPKSVTALLKAFKTVAAIRAATPEALTAVVGRAKAMGIHAYFHPKNDD